MTLAQLRELPKLKYLLLGMTLFATVSFLSSCDDDEEGAKPAPTISLDPSTGSNAPGFAVTTTVTIDAPAGGETLSILVNGAADANLPDVDLEGETSTDYTLDYTIPETATVGSTIVFTLTTTDVAGETAMATFTATVTDVPSKPVVTVNAGHITENTTWTKDKIYLLKGYVFIGEDVIAEGQTSPTINATAELTIEEGTVIMGDRDTKGTLIISRGSKIFAEGTAEEPIVFTSSQPIGQREPGDWGGLVICGKGINNLSTTLGAGIAELEGAYGAYHGGGANSDNADNSGVVKYVRIEYAGTPINPNQEVNSLTMGSVGSGTTIENVQCTYGLDDSFEFFGGAVNCKYLVAYKGLDDDFDCDNGFVGKVQYAVSVREETLADQSGSNGFEVDNDGTGSGATPFTAPVFSNVTIMGAKSDREAPISLQFQNAMHLRRNNKIKIINSVFTGFPNGLFIDGTATATNAANGDLILKNIILAGVDSWGGNGYGSAGTIFPNAPANGAQHPTNPRGADIATASATIGGESASTWFLAQTGNESLAKYEDAGLKSVIYNQPPDFLPTAGSKIFTKTWDAFGQTGLETATFIGAFGTTDWTEGWTNFNPALTDYSR